MAKVCEMCGKSTMYGHNIQHKAKGKWRYKAPRSNRTFKPNLTKVTLVDDEGNKTKVTICMKCYKRLRKEAEEENNS
ncbi:50S ribosomal protein L28 [Candidatus Dojkabacteria bacterium]|nr:50S ribosomal protein L28 [Candidatus Dojkabacteria bacterium]